MSLFGPFVDKQGPPITAALLNLLDAIQNAVSANSVTKVVTIGPPTAGAPLVITANTNGPGTTWTDGTRSAQLFISNTAGQEIVFGATTAHALDLVTNSTQRVTISSSGQVVISQPSSTQSALIVNGFQTGNGTNPALNVSGDIQSNQNVNGHTFNWIQNLSAGASAACSQPLFNDTGQGFDVYLTSSGYVGHVIANDPGAGAMAGVATTGTAPISFGTQGKERMRLDSVGKLIFNPPDNGDCIITNGAAGAYSASFFGSSTSGQSFGVGIGAGTTSADQALNVQNAALTLTFFNIKGDGSCQFPQVSTTASAANAFLDNTNSNNLLRSTSSLRYKRDVENLDISKARQILSKLRPVWYRSKAKADREDWSWYGLIAEEVAKVEPRLVHWTKIGKDLVPDSVMYDRVAVLILPFVQKILGEQNVAAS